MYRRVDWSERAAHMEEGHGVTVEQAEEALAEAAGNIPWVAEAMRG